MMAYFKLVVNNNDDESFKRVVNKPARSIGDTTLGAVIAAARAEGVSLFNAASGDKLAEYGLKSAAISKLSAFCAMIASLSARASGEDAYELARAIALESGMMQMLKSDLSAEGQARLGNVEELLNNVKQVVEEKHNADMEELLAASDSAELENVELPVVLLADYLENISLLSSIDMGAEEGEGEDATNRVAMMTVHSSKGLEFPYVFVSGMEEGLFPSGGPTVLPQELQEERRLFYVAITRAMKALSISFSKTRMKNGQTDYHSPSRFLREIDSSYFRNPLTNPFEVSRKQDPPSPFFATRPSSFGNRPSSFGNRPSSSGSRPSSFGAQKTERLPNLPPPPEKAGFVPSPVSELREGQRVEHNRFGMGTLKSISGHAADMTALVEFDNFGEKKLILKYAKLRIIF